MTDEKHAGPPLTGLQEQLYGNASNEVRTRVKKELDAWQADLQQAMRSGLEPSGYKRAEAISKGLDAAQKLIAERPGNSTD